MSIGQPENHVLHRMILKIQEQLASMDARLPPLPADADTTQGPKLLPCPFCGGGVGTALIVSVVNGNWLVCPWCKAEGPHSTDDKSAAEMWNERSSGK